MAGQNLQTNIIINARTGNGFSQVGSTLTELGTLVNGFSEKLIDFGKDSIKVYREYEKSMRDAEVALSTTYGRSTKELAGVMSQLDTSATEWAATTIFHTNDVANAISEAAHAGWNYEQIMNGIPAAMELAQAGSLDLSEAVNYIVKSTNAAGIGFEDLENFTDLWTFAANSSASTIGEFGDAMLRMGSTMRFTGNTEELMTLLAVTANAGSVGSEAGTMVRNSMIRLLAPTQKAEKAMALLGATTDETAGLMEDEALAAANAELAAHGFSAYDQTGNLKNVLDIYNQLYLALGDIAGGYENIDRNQDAIQILSSIFPTRTITEALTLIRSASENYQGLYDAMRSGAAEGYGQYAAATMMDTLNGKIETFESKVERLKQVVGAELKEDVVDFAGFAGDLVDGLAQTDPDTLSALVKGMEVIAGAGPGLLLAGGALRLFGNLLTPTGAIGVGLIALTAAAVAIHDLEESKFADNFGDMKLDTAGISSYVQSIGTGFRSAYDSVNEFKQALEGSVTSYQNASSAFSGTLLTKMLTGAKLTDTDISTLQGLGDDMFEAVQEAITYRAATSMNFWQTLFGGAGEAESSAAFREIIDLTNETYEGAISEAEGISRELRNAMNSAFADGQISEEEYQNILSYMQSYNDAVAQAAAEAKSEEDYVQMQKWLHQGQTASLEEIQKISDEATAARDQLLTEQEDTYLSERFRLEYRGADASTLAEADQRFQSQQSATRAQYDEMLTKLWGSQIQQSDQSANFEYLSGLASLYLAGGLSSDTADRMLTEQMGKNFYAGDGTVLSKSSDRSQLGRMLGTWLYSVGGERGVEESIAYYRGEGNNPQMAAQLEQLYAMEQLVNDFRSVVRADEDNFLTTAQLQAGHGQDNKKAAEAAFAASMGDYSAETARRTVDTFSGETDRMSDYFNSISLAAANGTVEYMNHAWAGMSRNAQTEYSAMIGQMMQTYDFDKVLQQSNSFLASPENAFRYDYAAYQLLYGEFANRAEDFRIKVIPEVDTSGIPGQFSPVPVAIEPYVAGTDAIESLQNQGVDVQVGADASSLTATIDAQDGQKLLEYVNGDARNLQMTIKSQDGRVLTERVYGNTSALQSAISAYDGQTITVNIQGRRLFASGGRATSPSTFGEAGPEWAIPEAHTERTASLLNAARAASGFTWPDLLARFGGFNATPNPMPTTIVYSPTIHANDARGVDAALRDDKRRLEKWFEDKKIMDAVEVYA